MGAFESSRMEAGSVGPTVTVQGMIQWMVAQKQEPEKSVSFDSRKLGESVPRPATRTRKEWMKVQAREAKTSREHGDPAVVDEQ